MLNKQQTFIQFNILMKKSFKRLHKSSNRKVFLKFILKVIDSAWILIIYLRKR